VPEHQPEVRNAVGKVYGLFDKELFFCKIIIQLPFEYVVEDVVKDDTANDEHHPGEKEIPQRIASKQLHGSVNLYPIP
jgi:hypothetical protein